MVTIEDIMVYFTNNARYFNLRGIEFTNEDCEAVFERMEALGETMEQAADNVMEGIAECLEDGLEDFT